MNNWESVYDIFRTCNGRRISLWIEILNHKLQIACDISDNLAENVLITLSIICDIELLDASIG